MPRLHVRPALQSVLLMFCGVLLACVAGEILVRIATANQENYVVEMWRYARLLKERSPDPKVGHQNRPSSSARLEGVDVSFNALGMRGPMPDPRIPADRTVVILGDSVALGWGVPEQQTLRAQLARALGTDIQVLNAGVGNMNLAQVVALWSHLRTRVHAGTIIVLATARSSAVQPPDTTNWLVEHSELAALTVTFFRQSMSGATGRDGLVAAYRRDWTNGAGLDAMRGALDQLKQMQAQRKPRIIVASMPETHDMKRYSLGFITASLKHESLQRGWEFVDLLPLFGDEPSENFTVSPQDAHPNGEAFRRIAARLAPMVQRAATPPPGCKAGPGTGPQDCPPAH
ncbi:MAG: hypothetical protein WC804_06625 [Sphingomonas sp.]|jgi:hypothetical protein|uniref:SGNH/GDSL hydrolase family protein n=1 Tax=Sphingomonas sp. TaxID=28214 RepID=UPI0035687F6B